MYREELEAYVNRSTYRKVQAMLKEAEKLDPNFNLEKALRYLSSKLKDGKYV
jgi:hypothetical protein